MPVRELFPGAVHPIKETVNKTVRRRVPRRRVPWQGKKGNRHMADSETATLPRLEEALNDSIQYKGRKAARAKSEHRRRLILEAALRIVAREGVRGVKHRAVAREANVPLASTTYYFKDIEELISDAFNLFAEKSKAKLEFFYSELNRTISAYDLETVRQSPEQLRKLADDMLEMGVRYTVAQVKFRSEDLLGEQAFLLESVRDERLKVLARTYKEVWLVGLVDFLRRLGSVAPEEDAAIIMGTVAHMEYEGALNNGELNLKRVRTIWRQLVDMMLGLRKGVL
ncbi:MAG: TetR family transcriptional regulator [Gammaproteobacteria bacterium]|nr:MAG: TetR family transcriptional regulator [Gammaproteobacteria bacterium]